MSLFQARPGWPYHISSGGVVYRRANEDWEVLLLKSRFKGDFPWHLPKGALDKDERLEEAAQRETEEEAGVRTQIEAYLGASHYHIPTELHGYPIDKTVHYFLMKFVEDHPDGMDREHDSRQWFPIDQAIELLDGGHHKAEEKIVGHAKTWLEEHGG